MDDKGNLKFQPGKIADGLLAAHQAGAITSDQLKDLLGKATDADKAFGEQQALQARVGNDAYAKAKAVATGATRGGAFLAGALPAGSIAAEAAAPLAPFTFGLAPVVAGGLAGLAGGYLSERAASALGNELAKHSDTIKSFADASKALPQYDAAGNLISMIVPGVAGAANLARVTGIRAAESGLGSALATGGKELASGALDGVVFEAGVRPIFDQAVQAAGLGDPDKPAQAPTLHSIAAAGLLGALLPQLGIKFKDYDASATEALFQRANLRENAGLGLDATLDPAKVANHFGYSQEQAAKLAPPLTPAEQEFYQNAKTKIHDASPAPGETGNQVLDALRTADGKLVNPKSTGGSQALRGDKPYGVVTSGVGEGSTPTIPGISGAPVDPNAPVPPAPEPSIESLENQVYNKVSPFTLNSANYKAKLEGWSPRRYENELRGHLGLDPLPDTPAPAPDVTQNPELESDAAPGKGGSNPPPAAPVIPGIAEPPAPVASTKREGEAAPKPANPSGPQKPTGFPDLRVAGESGGSPASGGSGTSSPTSEPAKGSQAPTDTSTTEAPAGEPSPRPAGPATATAADDGGKGTVTHYAPEPTTGENEPPVNPELGDTIITKDGQKLTVTGGDADTITAHPAGNPELTAHYSRAAIAAGLASGQSQLQKADIQPSGQTATSQPESSAASTQTPSGQPPTSSRGNEPAAPAVASAERSGQKAGPEGSLTSSPESPATATPARTEQDRQPQGSSPDLTTHEPNTQVQSDAQPPAQEEAASPAKQGGAELAGDRQRDQPVSATDGTASGSSTRQPVTVASAREHLTAAQDAHAPEIKHLGASFKETDSTIAPAGFAMETNGAPVIYHNTPVIARSAEIVRQLGGDPKAWASSAVQEELIHHCDVKASGDRFESIHSRIYSAMSKAARAAIFKIYPDTKNPLVQAAEYMRALAQQRAGTPITESHFRDTKALEAILAGPQPKAVEDHLAKMERLAPQTQAPVPSRKTEVNREVDRPTETAPPPSQDRAERSPSDIHPASSSSPQGTPATPFRQGDSAIYKGRAATVEKIEGGRATVKLRATPTLKGETKTVGVGDLKEKPARSFILPDAPQESADIIDIIHNNGGMIGKGEAERRAKMKGLTDGAGADYNDLPDLKGVYQSKIFGGTEEPNQMAATIHDLPNGESYGDGTVGTMYGLIDKAMRTRISIKTASINRAKKEQEMKKQSTNFQRDAETPGKKKKEIHAGNLNVGDTVKVGDQQLKVIDVDPDSEDVTLEDHSVYGTQKIGPNAVLYVEKVRRATGSSDFAPTDQDHAPSTSLPSTPANEPTGDTTSAEAALSPQRTPVQSRPSDQSKSPVSSPEPTQPAPDLKLESVTGQQLDSEREKLRQKRELEERKNKKLSGKEIDTTGDFLDPLASDNPLFSQPSKPVAPKISDAASKALDDAFSGLFAANPAAATASLAQEELPPDKIGPFVAAAQALIGSGIDTPEAMAAVLDQKFQGKARKYSEALWDAFGMAKKALRGSHDWTHIYQKLDSQSQPATVNAGESSVIDSTAQRAGSGGENPSSQPQPSSSNDRNRRPHLEPDRQDAGTDQRSSEVELPVRPGSAGEDGERLDAAGEERGDRSPGGPMSADVPSVAHREASNPELREPAPGTAERPAGSERHSGRDVADVSGISPERDAAGPASITAGVPALAQTLDAGSQDRGDTSTPRQSAAGGDVGGDNASPGWHQSLTPEQVADGQFIERRLFENKKPGVVLTNGTGTGKTFSGMGAIKRRLDAGENHILVVAPSDKIGGDWVQTAKDFFGVPDITQLESVKDNAPEYRVVVTTYANLGQNSNLVQRPWGMLVADEAHYLSASAEGKTTAALDAFRALTFHPAGTNRRAQMLEPEAQATVERLRQTERDAKGLTPAQKQERDDALAKLDKARQAVRAEQATRGEAGRPKALMLSATPFAYHFSLDYGEGYVFDYPPENQRTVGSYGHASPRSQFYMDNFGYRMRTGKLTQPENATATGILERRFAEKLMKDGAMAGRSLQVPHDYSRQFVLNESSLGSKIDEVMKALHGDPELGALTEFLGVGDYLSRRYLLEALKARDSIPRIQEHLALGRKVVVYHDYNKGGAENPLRPTFSPGQKATVNTPNGPQVVDLAGAYRKLAAQVSGFDDVVNQLDALKSPIETFKEAFPNGGIFNGTVSKGERRRLVEEFNKSGGDMNVLLVQRASGKEGISLHDRDGQHQRVLIDLGIPAKPTDAIQTEGRINRHGLKSNAVVEYLTTGTDFERWTFAQTIAQRASTAENLAMGERARNLLQAFASGYNDAEASKPGASQGTGGKQADAALENGDPYKNAVALYYTNAKKTSRNKSAEGVDYFPTPEPLAFKMVEWAGIKPGESVLEPSAGHGAIARFFPDAVNKTGVEPSNELASRLALNAPDINIRQQRFEDHHISNKYDAIVMNPPFGTAGRTAVDHLIKASQHLREGGRIVALLPEGSATDKFNKWYFDDPQAENISMAADFGLPPVAFERAGTKVKAHVVVLDKLAKNQKRPETQRYRDIGGESITEFFDRLANQTVPDRQTGSQGATPDRSAPVGSATEGATSPKPASDVPSRQPQAAQQVPVSSPTSTIPTPTRDSNFSPADFLHTKSRTPVFVAKPERRYSHEEYKEQLARAKELGGHYSSFKGQGAIPGFHFKTAEARDAFIGTDGPSTLGAANPARDAQTDTPEFKRWFGDSKVVDEDGKPLKVGHGTEAGGFAVFRTPSFFTESKAEAEAYSNITDTDGDTSVRYEPVGERQIPQISPYDSWPMMSDYVGPANKIAMDGNADRYFYWDGTESAYGDKNFVILSGVVPDANGKPVLRPTKDDQGDEPRQLNRQVYQVYLSIQNPKVLPWDQANLLGKRLGADQASVRAQVKAWKAQGYDGIQTTSDDGEMLHRRTIRQWIPFDASQIKSATDNNGDFDPSNPSILYAANPIRAVYDQAADEYASRDQKDRVKSGYDSANNIPEMRGEQAGTKIRLDFVRPHPADETRAARKAREAEQTKDTEAMPYVIEAGHKASNLAVMRQKIATSVDPKLAKDMLPGIDHAIANFARLNPLRLTNHDTIMAAQLAKLKAAGVTVGEVENYVTRKLDQPDAVNDTLPNPLFSMGGGQQSGPRYFTKGRSFETLADAIHAGYRPKSTNLAELDRHRIAAGERILEQKAFIERLKATPSPTDGKPIVGQFGTKTVLSGATERTTPQGYTSVRTTAGEVPIHNQFAHLFKDLYGDSAARRLTIFRAAMKAAALTKQYTLLLDTFHIGRLLYKMAVAGGGAPVTFKNGKPQWNIRHGLALIEYDDADLGRAVAAGEISQSDADYAKAMRGQSEELLANGLNVGRVADNLVQQAHVHVPGLNKFNDWIFGKLSRAAMIQTALTGFKRNLDQFPERTREQNARQTAKEMNELFGNLQNQGLFTNKTFQDIARMIFLAPQWTESQLRYEGRAYGQIGRGIYDAIRGGGGGKPPTPPPGGWPGGVAPTPPAGGWPRGKRFRLGNAARAMAAGLAALFAANQLINLLSRHQFTWDNEEDGHKLDAFIPGGKRGFWFNPFEIAGEYAHAAFKYAAQHENPVDIASHVVSNKLSPIARGAKDILTGRDYSGKHYLDNGDRFRAGIIDALPSPIPLGGVLEKDPRQPLGYRLNRQPGSVEKQLLASVGAKTANAQSPRSQMFALAAPFRPDRGTSDAAGEYTELRRALDNDDKGSSQSEIQWLLGRGKSIGAIERAVGISRSAKDGSISVKPEQFAGSADAERQFVASLTPEQSKVYQEAQQDHIDNAQKLLSYSADLLRDDADARKLASMNAASDKAKVDRNKAAAKTPAAKVAVAPRPAPVFAGF